MFKLSNFHILSHVKRFSISTFHYGKNQFTLPVAYRPNKPLNKGLPFSQCFQIWRKSLSKNRLQQLQDDLVELMISSKLPENAKIAKSNRQVIIDEEGNYINELCLEIVHEKEKPVKNIVFIHGYGAALGCFARNFQLINLLSNDKYNYKIHFLDNLSFGLSSNPASKSPLLKSKLIPKCLNIELNDPEPTKKEKLYRRYYKLIKSFKVDENEFKQYQTKFIPILKDIEDYYVEALENWRLSSQINEIDYLIGHSYGGYWAASYSVRYSKNLSTLILLSPVGVERHAQAVTSTIYKDDNATRVDRKLELKPELDPTSYKFLTRIPILSKNHIFKWYYVQPYLPSFLKCLGPFGVGMYHRMWYSKLFKINKIIDTYGGAKNIFASNNDLIYGTNKECNLIIEYLYNAISHGSVSDFYIKNLLTPSTVSKWPLYDKFMHYFKNHEQTFDIHLLYGQYDFMNSEAGEKLVNEINNITGKKCAHYYEVNGGGHNLYIDNPFGTHKLLKQVIETENKKSTESH